MLLALFAAALEDGPTLRLPAIFSDNMVLQRDMALTFFGEAKPGQKVSVHLPGQSAETTALPDGTWSVKLSAMRAGGPFTISVVGDKTIRIQNVVVGEVWVASGQSNMEWRQADSDDFELARREASSAVRMFTVPRRSLESPARDVQGSWIPAHPDTVANFSAVANAFAKQLHRELGVPIGILHTSWGGTPAESWTSRSALSANPALEPILARYLATIADFPGRQAAYEQALKEWNALVFKQDPRRPELFDWYASPDADVRSWRMVKLPGSLETTEGRDMDGAVWYRKTVEVPAAWTNKELLLELGPIDDFDDTYVNGRRVGRTDASTALWYTVPRRYVVPAGLLRPGQNVIAVRVFDQGSRGGFGGSAEQMRWGPTDGSTGPISLAGDWLSKVEVAFEPPPASVLRNPPQQPFGPGHPWAPGGLYNAMIAPLIPYAIRGAIWYQGESNAGRAYQYRELFPAMIRDWRQRWGQGDFPFYFVQLANFTARNDRPVESDWAELREAQSMTLSLPNTGMAVAIDIGDANDIHPRNKREVGRRLALNALAKTYRKSVEFSGPMFDAMRRDGPAIVLRFRHATGLKTRDGRAPVGVAVAGQDRVFHWAEARIEGDSVRVWSPAVPEPVAVRYGWSNNPDVNLVNEAGLPASPFRTDDWPGITAGKS